LLAAQCGFAFEILYTIFWGYFGHNLPPASPNFERADLASFFAQHHNAISLETAWPPWSAFSGFHGPLQLVVVMWRIEGSSPVLTIIEVIGGALTAWALMFCSSDMGGRRRSGPMRNPNTVRMLLNDLGFILFNINLCDHFDPGDLCRLVGLADKGLVPVFSANGQLLAIFTGLSFLRRHDQSDRNCCSLPVVHIAPDASASFNCLGARSSSFLRATSAAILRMYTPHRAGPDEISSEQAPNRSNRGSFPRAHRLEKTHSG